MLITRWHEASCDVPDVILNNGVPICRGCGAHAPPENITDDGQQRRQAQVPWEVPQDEPAGQLNLSWPSCVPWSGEPSSAKGHGRAASRQAKQEPPKSDALVYDRSLAPHEFRLLCLAADSDVTNPIHVTLETYQLDNSPEYEATSYTWATKDGDRAPRKHIFVGSHWDALPVTSSCFSLLQYLRPKRGIRLVWVDAVCINQEDVAERDSQVSIMALIYKGCTRVVIYLGDDVVHQSSKEYRSRFELEELDTVLGGRNITFLNLLSHKYFSRIWIIQEVLNSRSSVFPVGDMDFTTGVGTAAKMSRCLRGSDWSATGSPWLRYLHNRQDFSASNLFHALRQTWNSEATDPRDRIFAVFGLLNGGPSQLAFGPDYTKSQKETMIGTFAYILLFEEELSILIAASPTAGQSTFPSWVPDWRSPLLWSEPLKLKQRYLDGARKEFFDECDNSPKSMPRYGVECTIPGMTYVVQDRVSTSLYNPTSLFKRYPGAETPEASRDFIANRRFVPRGPTRPDHESCLHDRTDSEQVALHTRGSVDRSTGALSVEMTHLMEIGSRPVFRRRGTTIQALEFSLTETSKLYMVISPPFLGNIPDMKSVHLFTLSRGLHAGSHKLLLWMKKMKEPNDYQLLCCRTCHDLILSYHEGPPWASSFDFHYFHYGSDLDSQGRNPAPFTYVVDSWKSLYCELEDVAFYGEDMDQDPAAARGWPFNRLYKSYQGMLDAFLGRPGCSNFRDAYAKFVADTFSGNLPTFDGDWIYFWLENQSPLLVGNSPSIWQWTEDGNTGLLDGNRLAKASSDGMLDKCNWKPIFNPKDLTHRKRTLNRGRMQDIQDTILRSDVFGILFRLSFYSEASREAEYTMAQRYPREEDKRVYPREWPLSEQQKTELGFDGTVQRVRIV